MPPRANAPDPFAEFAVSDTAAADPFSEFAAPTAPVSAANPQGASLVASTPLRRFGAALPGTGAMLGGMLGGGVGPASRAGAALFGGGGEAANQLIQYGTGAPDQPTSSRESFQRILGAGASGAGAQLGGEVLAGGANAIGRRAIGSAIGKQTLNKIATKTYGFRRFPFTADKLIDVITKNRLPINQRGAALADKRVTELGATKARELAAADRTGMTAMLDDALKPVLAWRAELAKGTTNAARITEVDALIDQVTNNFGTGKLNPTRIDEMLTSAQKIGFTRHEHTAATPIEQQFNRKLSQGAHTIMRRIAPSVAKTRSQTYDFMAARDAISAAAGRSGVSKARLGIAAGMAGVGALATPGGPTERTAGGLGATALTAAALSRPGMNMLGMGLTHPLLAQLLLRSPNALRALAGAAAEPPLDDQQP